MLVKVEEWLLDSCRGNEETPVTLLQTTGSGICWVSLKHVTQSII